MIGVRFSAVDTLFFRDGTPFASDGTSQADVGGMFPPSPESVVGAVRAALARYNGWNGQDRRWPADLNPVLGNGPEDLGSLSFEAPFLLQDDVPLIPVPRHVVGHSEGDRWHPRALLGPGSPVTCDLGDGVRLPQIVKNPWNIKPEELKAASGWWLKLNALGEVLRGGLPPEEALVAQKDLWRVERRIGLERDANRRSAQEGRLYSARFVRLLRGVAIGARVAGWPAGWSLPSGSLVPFGGEGRLAACEPWEAKSLDGLDMPVAEAFASGRLMVIALTPLVLDGAACRGEAPIPGLGDARLVSACLDRPLRIGGWNSLERSPSPVRSVLPAGSVLFCETSPASVLDAIARRGVGLPRIGERTAYGYGVVAIGVWPNG